MSNHIHEAGPNEVAVNPTEIRSAATRLDQLAARLDAVLDARGAELPVAASGTDEVSVRAAGTFNAVAQGFTTESGSAAHELRKIAAVLRSQAQGYDRAEDDNIQTFLS